jgi:hypothetical protein
MLLNRNVTTTVDKILPLKFAATNDYLFAASIVRARNLQQDFCEMRQTGGRPPAYDLREAFDLVAGRVSREQRPRCEPYFVGINDRAFR